MANKLYRPPGSVIYIQDLLVAGKDLNQITDGYKINIKRHQKFDNLVLFKYDQIESDFTDPLVRQCRGLILDEGFDWKCVSRPFDKFFNYGETLAAPIDWDRCDVYEKLDGTMIQMYYHGGEWHVGTTGTPDASGQVGDFPFTFEELFWATWKKRFPASRLPDKHWNYCTFIFELTTPYNRIVVDHKEADIHLIAIRDKITGHEFNPQMWKEFNPVERYNVKSDIKDIQASFHEMNPLQQEGYVVVDHKYKRIKVKHPGYVALHHTVSSFSDRSILEIIRNGDHSEVVASFPEWKERFDDLSYWYTKLLIQIDEVFEEYGRIEDRKEFALKVKDLFYSGALFCLKGGKVGNAREFLKQIHIDRLMDWVKRMEVEVVCAYEEPDAGKDEVTVL